ncbi:uncharacterized protein B0I36DRAFT_52271 [Microdochium trichocladiopsis]|uniref:Uncharacterized protein n=1 Tax=Microdochium trichocladiopsis TaxID=1682393 RepID=A0A9P8XRH7_9PEZI|nr:uncharacterized protein B0I36DRAFT_52271 [Microdochium trichocladiopsis]KAH7012587.1 hypothetical protein B0I36DRAFT_52271 [Microdochium trichocladiopsis]
MVAAHSTRTRSKVQLTTPRARLSRAATRRSSKPALWAAGIGAAVEPLPPTQPSARNHQSHATQPRRWRQRTPIAGHQHRRRGVRRRGTYRTLPEAVAAYWCVERPRARTRHGCSCCRSSSTTVGGGGGGSGTAGAGTLTGIAAQGGNRLAEGRRGTDDERSNKADL